MYFVRAHSWANIGGGKVERKIQSSTNKVKKSQTAGFYILSKVHEALAEKQLSF